MTDPFSKLGIVERGHHDCNHEFPVRLMAEFLLSDLQYSRVISVHLLLGFYILKVYTPFLYYITALVCTIFDTDTHDITQSIPEADLPQPANKFVEFLDDKAVISSDDDITKLLRNGYSKYRYVSDGFLKRNGIVRDLDTIDEVFGTNNRQIIEKKSSTTRFKRSKKKNQPRKENETIKKRRQKIKKN